MAAERTADPEAETRLEGAKERLQQGAAETPEKGGRHPKAPATFHVFLLREADALPVLWESLTAAGPVTAPNRKQAIHEVSSPMTLEEKASATFWAVPADQFQPLKPKPRQQVVYDWE